jgi:hypothetical protein
MLFLSGIKKYWWSKKGSILVETLSESIANVEIQK